MVGPMSMLVMNLRWFFITAVTPTSVAPTAVILKRKFGRIYTILHYFGKLWAILGKV